MNKLLSLIEVLARTLAAICIALITLVMAAQVFFRYVLVDALTWSEGLSVYALVWVVFIGAIIITSNREHVAIRSFVDYLPLKFRTKLYVATNFVCLIFFVTVAWIGFYYVFNKYHSFSPSVGISTKWVKLAIPVCSSVMSLISLQQIAKDLLAIRRGETDNIIPKTSYTD